MSNRIIYSIIIPHHNTPVLLQRCLDSIPRKDDLEVVIVDDNSSKEIVDFENFPGLGVKNIQIIFTKDGRGAGYARNVGLQYARGRWILFADSDDLFCKGFYEAISEYKEYKTDLFLFKVRSVKSTTLEPDSNRDRCINDNIDKCLKSKITPKELAISYSPPWGKMISSDLIRSKSICFDEIPRANDVMFSVKIACYSKKITIVNKFLYTMTTREGSLASDTNKNEKNYLYRLNIKIRRNQFLTENGEKPYFLLTEIFQAKEFGILTVFKTIRALLLNKMLFVGLGNYIVYLWNRKHDE